MSNQGEPGDDDYVAPQSPALTPQAAPTIDPIDDADFDVVETDGAGQPLGQQPAQDTRLTADHGEQPLIRPDQDQDGRKPMQPRSARRQRQREARGEQDRRNVDLENQNRILAERLQIIEGRLGGVQDRTIELGEANIRQQVANIDQQLAEETARYNTATARMADAMQNADHAGLTAALEARDTALVRKTQLANTKQAVDGQLKRITDARPHGGDDRQQQQPDRFDARRQPEQPQGVQLTARGRGFVQQFQGDYDWYDPNGSDLDSQIVGTIDRDVHRRGFDPNTQEYWDEVDRVMQEKLPHRFQQDGRMTEDGQQRQQQPAPRQQAQPAARRAPPVAAPADRAAPAANGRRQVKIDPQRKEAMILSGSIDSSGRVIDATKYKNQLKSFERYDRENPR